MLYYISLGNQYTAILKLLHGDDYKGVATTVYVYIQFLHAGISLSYTCLIAM